jgi:hypothetical protein
MGGKRSHSAALRRSVRRTTTNAEKPGRAFVLSTPYKQPGPILLDSKDLVSEKQDLPQRGIGRPYHGLMRSATSAHSLIDAEYRLTSFPLTYLRILVPAAANTSVPVIANEDMSAPASGPKHKHAMSCNSRLNPPS